MKQDIRSSAWFKAITLLLTLACAVAATFGWLYCCFSWDSLFDNNYTYSIGWNQAMSAKHSHLLDVLEDYDTQRRDQSLGYLEEQFYQERLEALGPENTNFRYIIRDNDTGEILLSSSGENSLDHVSYDGLTRHIRTITPSSIDYNYRQYDDEIGITIFFDGEGNAIGEVTGNARTLYQDGETYQYALEYGVDERYLVQDEFRELKDSFTKGDIRVLWWAAALTLVTLAGTVLLMCCAGRRRGVDTFTLNWSDKIPYDLYLFGMGWAVVICIALGCNVISEACFYHLSDPSFYVMIGIGGAAFTAGFALAEAALMSSATRFKTHTLFRNTLTWGVLRWFGRLFLKLGSWWSVTDRKSVV